MVLGLSISGATFLGIFEEIMSVEELKRQFRVIDMMLTMHSVLRDQNQKRALAVDLLILCLSVLLCATVFLDPVILIPMGIEPTSTRLAIGILSILVFILSLTSLRVSYAF